MAVLRMIQASRKSIVDKCGSFCALVLCLEGFDKNLKCRLYVFMRHMVPLQCMYIVDRN